MQTLKGWLAAVGVLAVLVAHARATTVPLIHYSFDDSAAPGHDDSGHGSDATLEGGASWSSLAPGPVGGAGSLLLDGLDGQAVAYGTETQFLSEYTAALWIRYRTPNGRILTKGPSGPAHATNYSLWLLADGSVMTEHESDGTTGWSCTSDPLAADEWYHVATTYDGSVLRLYLDGDLACETAAAGPGDVGDSPMVLGHSLESAAYFDGWMDEFYLYDRALGRDEIRQAAGIPEPLTLAGLALGIASAAGYARRRTR